MIEIRSQSFRDRVRAVVAKIPKGKSMTYKEVATKAGNPKAARAVGAIMRSNYNHDIPCHRVVKSDGSLGGYHRPGRDPAGSGGNRGGTLRKYELLKSEDAL
ncbi:MGMT family protein [Candidatus Kaiserbacteria bacterium]|nr:MGMT family protein [Candidatus Kaiserbacteria bacterium]